MVDLGHGLVMYRSMVGWQYFLMWLMPVIGAGVGGLLGWMKKEEKFNWKWFAVTIASGVCAGGLWVLALWLPKAPFYASFLVAGLLVGIGFDFLVKKFPIMP